MSLLGGVVVLTSSETSCSSRDGEAEDSAGSSTCDSHSLTCWFTGALWVPGMDQNGNAALKPIIEAMFAIAMDD